MLQLLGAGAAATALGTGFASASDGPRHLQVSAPSELCGVVPGSNDLALIEDPSQEKGRGFYAGTEQGDWDFAGWLKQTEPTEKASDAIKPESGATELSHRLGQVSDPEELTKFKPNDQQFVFITDTSHERGRGFYAGGPDGKWYFVGWLTQSEPSEVARGSASPKSDSKMPDQRLLQVSKPKQLEKYEPSQYHLAYIEDESHERGRGFYAGGSDGNWYFIGWLAQTPPTGTVSDSLDPNGGICSDDSTEEPTETTGVTNGTWFWFAEDIGSYESWLGEEINVAASGRGKNRWRAFIDFDTRDFPSWVEGGSDRIFLPHIPMLPREENDDVGRATALRKLAAGDYDDKFRSMAEGFKSDGFTSDTLVLRIGNEFNIEAQPYSPVGTDVSAETWKEGYRRIVDICRDVLGADLRTVWAPLVHSTQMSTQEVIDHYPSAEYAIVGADIYDSAPAYGRTGQAPDGIDYDTASETDRQTVQEHVWTETHLGGEKWGADGVGLDDIAQLANEVGRPIVIPEWGLSFDDYEWGGDVNPTFVQNMYEWMNEHDVLFHAYFEHDTSRTDHAIGPGGDFDFETAEAAYIDSFGPDSSGDDSKEEEPETDGTNYVFLNESTLEEKRTLVDAGKEPWVSAHDNLLSDADQYLGTNLKSVTDDDGSHEFTDSNDRYDYLAAVDMSEWARDCALAYQFTGKDRYAERAVEIIHHWCLKDGTYMKPTVEIVSKNDTIEQHLTIPAFMYAASLVRGHTAWDSYEGDQPWDGGSASGAEAAFRNWIRTREGTFVTSRPGYCEYDSKWAWRIVDRGATAAYLQDDDKMEKARCMWKGQCATCDDKKRPWHDFVNNYKNRRSYDGNADPNNNGLFKRELNLSDGYSHSSSNLKAMIEALVIFEQYDGTELYDYNAPTDRKSGSSLWKAFNWLEEYAQDTDAWDWNEGSVSRSEVEELTSAFEIAHNQWGEFSDPLTNPDKISGRPHYDTRLLGHVTLTHGGE